VTLIGTTPPQRRVGTVLRGLGWPTRDLDVPSALLGWPGDPSGADAGERGSDLDKLDHPKGRPPEGSITRGLDHPRE
jgi:hypothetical protein